MSKKQRNFLLSASSEAAYLGSVAGLIYTAANMPLFMAVTGSIIGLGAFALPLLHSFNKSAANPLTHAPGVKKLALLPLSQTIPAYNLGVTAKGTLFINGSPMPQFFYKSWWDSPDTVMIRMHGGCDPFMLAPDEELKPQIAAALDFKNVKSLLGTRNPKHVILAACNLDGTGNPEVIEKWIAETATPCLETVIMAEPEQLSSSLYGANYDMTIMGALARSISGMRGNRFFFIPSGKIISYLGKGLIACFQALTGLEQPPFFLKKIAGLNSTFATYKKKNDQWEKIDCYDIDNRYGVEHISSFAALGYLPFQLGMSKLFNLMAVGAFAPEIKRLVKEGWKPSIEKLSMINGAESPFSYWEKVGHNLSRPISSFAYAAYGAAEQLRCSIKDKNSFTLKI